MSASTVPRSVSTPVARPRGGGSGHGDALADPGAAVVGALGQGDRRPARVDGPVLAVQVARRRRRPGRRAARRSPARRGEARRPPGRGGGRRWRRTAARRAALGVRARLTAPHWLKPMSTPVSSLQPRVEVDAVGGELGERVRRAHVRDQPGGVPARAGGHGGPVDEQDVLHAEADEVVGDARADDAGRRPRRRGRERGGPRPRRRDRRATRRARSGGGLRWGPGSWLCAPRVVGDVVGRLVADEGSHRGGAAQRFRWGGLSPRLRAALPSAPGGPPASGLSGAAPPRPAPGTSGGSTPRRRGRRGGRRRSARDRGPQRARSRRAPPTVICSCVPAGRRMFVNLPAQRTPKRSLKFAKSLVAGTAAPRTRRPFPRRRRRGPTGPGARSSGSRRTSSRRGSSIRRTVPEPAARAPAPPEPLVEPVAVMQQRIARLVDLDRRDGAVAVRHADRVPAVARGPCRPIPGPRASGWRTARRCAGACRRRSRASRSPRRLRRPAPGPPARSPSRSA